MDKEHSSLECEKEEADTRDVLVSAASEYVTKLRARFQEVRSEVAVAVDWPNKQAVFLEGTEDRDYPYDQYPGWQFGTMDLEAVTPVPHLKSYELYVGDWKTGGSEGAEEQLLSLLAASRMAYQAFPYRWCPPAKMYISTLLVTEDGIKPGERVVSADELDAHVDAMSWRWEDLLKEQAEPVPGIHCTQLFCPHLSHCPAIGLTILEAAEGPKGNLKPEHIVRAHRMTDSPASDAEAAYIMERVSAAKRQLNYYTEAMKAYVDRGGSIRSGKFVWGPGKDGYRWRKSHE